MKTMILTSLAVLAFAVLLIPGVARGIGEKVHDALFDLQLRTGAILTAEVLGRMPTELAAGRKVMFDTQARSFMAVAEMPLVHAGAQIADTIGFGIILKKGDRLLCPPTLSNGAGTASSTLAIGLRDPVTKVAIDATAILAATAINAAQTIQANTGTKLTAGQRYVLPQDAEIYGTVAGAAIPANQAIRVEVPYIPA